MHFQLLLFKCFWSSVLYNTAEVLAALLSWLYIIKVALLTLPFAGHPTVTGHSLALFLLTECFFLLCLNLFYQHLYIYMFSPLNNSNIVLCECWYQKTSTFITLKMQIIIINKKKHCHHSYVSSSLNVFVFHSFIVHILRWHSTLALPHREGKLWKLFGTPTKSSIVNQIRWRTCRSAATLSLSLVVMVTFCCSNSATGLPGW